MGGHMAHNLLKAGHSLVVFDLNTASLDKINAQAAALKRKGTQTIGTNTQDESKHINLNISIFTQMAKTDKRMVSFVCFLFRVYVYMHVLLLLLLYIFLCSSSLP